MTITNVQTTITYEINAMKAFPSKFKCTLKDNRVLKFVCYKVKEECCF